MISIIIPVYNAAKWLPQCLDSVLKQDFKNIEVILVNDASTDNSLLICQKYADEDNRIVIIDKPQNEGVEFARHSGYSISKGKYVMYIDSDDWLEHPRVLTVMYQKAEETDADYVEIGIQQVFDRHKWIKRRRVNPMKSGTIDQTELYGRYYGVFFGSTMWGKLYRKSIIDKAGIKPLELIYGEDSIYNIQLLQYLNRVVVLDEIGYNYRYGGRYSRYNPRVFQDLKRVCCIEEELLQKSPYLTQERMDKIYFHLKEVLKSEICMMIEFGCESSNKIIAYLEKEIGLPLYENMLKVDENSGFWKDPLVQAFVVKDAETMYKICRKQVRQKHPIRMLKRFLVRIIQYL